ncbi:MAG: hypothetical protein ABSG32_06220 [Terriglobia bacterium]|jgi:hypothetical protein
MKTIMCCLALVALAMCTSAAFAQGPTLASVEAKFETTTDNKNPETKLDVYVKSRGGQDVAKSEGNEGLWDKHSTHIVTLEIEGNPTKAEVAHGSIVLTFHPRGGDTWKFNYKVTLKFSDDSSITKEVFGGVLTQYKTTRTDPL